MKKIILGLVSILSISFAQCGMGYGMRPMRPMMGPLSGILGFICLVFAFFLFSVIFWAVYIWIVKGCCKKEKNE